MRAIDRKLIRDLLHMKGQAIAIIFVIGCGVALFVMSLTTLESLQHGMDTYYERYRFAQVFTGLKRAPNALAERIEEIPGVARVQTRIVEHVTLDVESMAEPAVGRLVSIPPRPRPGLNELHLRAGRYIEPGRSGEVIASEPFCEAHGFQPGDTLLAVLNGRRQKLKIAGIALSPEYITSLQAGSILPDDKRFGVLWMNHEELEAAFNMEGAFNDVTLTLMRGANEEEVIRRIDRLLESYGGLGAYGRSDHVSHTFISDEIKQLKTMGVITPVIFLGVAAFLLNVVLKRLITTQREQIAALKAFGYSNLEVGSHYLKLVVLIVLAGTAGGCLAGIYLGRGMTEMYTVFYRFPVLGFALDWGVMGLAFAISLGSGCVGVFGAVHSAVKLPPAEAMRPEPPANYRPTLIERARIQHLFSQSARMILRELERRPLKSLFSSLGIALSVAILILGNFGEDAFDYMADFQFNLAERQDVTVSFVEPTSFSALRSVGHLPGVVHTEPFRSVPARLRNGHRERRSGIMGLQADPSLFRLIDADEKEITIPREGVMLSLKLAALLEVEVGDVLTVHVLEGERPVRKVKVSGLVNDFMGMSAYMNIRALNRMMREGRSISGAYLTVDTKDEETLYRRLKETPRVSGVTIKTAALRSFMDTMAESMLRMKAFNILFASIIAIGVVYNSARISLSERSRELATLRVLGFTRGEISAILLGELAILTLVALPLGMAIGHYFCLALANALDTELYRIPFVIKSSTYGFAGAVVVIAALASGLIVRRKLDRLDLVSVLKSRE